MRRCPQRSDVVEALADLPGEGIVEVGKLLFLDFVDGDADVARLADELVVRHVARQRQVDFFLVALAHADDLFREPGHEDRPVLAKLELDVGAVEQDASVDGAVHVRGHDVVPAGGPRDRLEVGVAMA